MSRPRASCLACRREMSINGMAHHLASHVAQPALTCPYCDRTFTFPGAQKTHINAHTPDTDASFFARVHMTDGCWIWQGGQKLGYGRFWGEGAHHAAHRFAYEKIVGPIPEGFHLDHLCLNKSCVRPDHLEPVTAWENTHRWRTGWRSPVLVGASDDGGHDNEREAQ